MSLSSLPNHSISLTLNGQPAHLPVGTTVQQLLVLRNLVGQPCAVEVNSSVIPHPHHALHVIAHGDIIEVVTLVGGG